MKKSKIVGIRKGEKINEYIFKKEDNLAENIIKLLKKLKFKDMELLMSGLFHENEKSGPSKTKYIGIKKITDKRENIQNKEYDIDIFFGAKEAFLVIRTSSDKQQKISNEIFKIGRFSKK